MKKTIVIGITASIAAYKTLDIVKELKKQGHEVHVIMTQHATSLVDPKDFEEASGNPVHTHLFHPETNFRNYLAADKPMEHISLADKADLFLICPATANALAKVANGIADDLLSTSILATNAPVIFAPAMNVKMWKHPVTAENVEKLEHMGYVFIDPEYGELACGYKGVGRLAGGEKIIEEVNALLKKTNQLEGKKVIVTAGATEESLDGVRVITNRASGKMGAAIADSAFLLGAEVILIRGKHAVTPRYHFKEIIVETADEMLLAIKEEITDANIFFHTAAVSDFAPQEKREEKVKSDKEWTLTLEPKLKIIGQLKKLNPTVFLVGFKAVYDVSKEELIEEANKLIVQTNADIIVGNDVGKKDRGFAVDTNEVYIVDAKKNVTHLPLAPKSVIASQLLDYVVKTIS